MTVLNSHPKKSPRAWRPPPSPTAVSTLWALALGDSYHDVRVSVQELDEFFQAPEAALQAAQEELGKLIICSWRNAMAEGERPKATDTFSCRTNFKVPHKTSHSSSPTPRSLFSASLGGRYGCRRWDEPRALFPRFCFISGSIRVVRPDADVPGARTDNPGLVDLTRQPRRIPQLPPHGKSLGGRDNYGILKGKKSRFSIEY